MSRFLRFLIVVTFIVHVPVALGAAELASRLGLPQPFLFGTAYGVIGCVFFFGRARAGAAEHRKSYASVWLADIPYFVHWCACIFTIIPAALFTILAPLVELGLGVAVEPPFAFYMWTYAAGLAVCGYGVLVRRRWFVTRDVEVAVAGLDPAFDGYRIAHLSDLHIGNTTPRAWGERWVRAANAKSPDLAVVTGDLVTSGTSFHGDIADVVGGLRTKDGTFVSMGNHDYFGSDGESLVAALGERGVRVLRNEGTTLERAAAQLYLAAIDDTWTKRDDMDLALRGRPQGTPSILLAHDPERFKAAAKRGVDLVLSGHTHGGQIAVPFLYRRLSLASFAHTFSVGMYKLGTSTLYVHPGLGTTGPPMRLGVAPALVVITLRAA